MSPSPVAAAAAATIHRSEQELPWADAGHGIGPPPPQRRDLTAAG